MIIATHGILASQHIGIDPDYLAFYNRVINAGGSLTTTEQTATEQLVKDLKSYSIWSKMKAIYPMVGASAAACAQNLKSSSFTGTFTSGWTFASTGVTPNGTSAYMDTGFNLNSQIGANTLNMTYYSRTNISLLQGEIGCYNPAGTTDNEILISYGGTFYGFNSPSKYISVSNSDSRGFYQLNAQGLNLKAFKNSSQFGTTVSLTTYTSTNANVYIGGVNNNGTLATPSSKECAFSSIGDGLTDTEASNFYTAVQAFQTTLSRNI